MSISADIGARAADRLGAQSRTGLWSLRDCIRRHPTLVHARLLPTPASNFEWVDAGGLPPGAFVADTMRGPVMHAAERDREFVARLTAKRAWLHVAQMMGIGWLAATDEARLLHDVAKVLPVAIATRGSHGEDALVDALRLTLVGAFGGGNHLQRSNLRHRRIIVRGRSPIG